MNKNDIKSLNNMLDYFNKSKGQVHANFALYGKNTNDITSVNRAKHYFDILVNDGYIKRTNHHNYIGMIEHKGSNFISKGGYKRENKILKSLGKYLSKYWWNLIVPIISGIIIAIALIIFNLK